MKLGNLKSSIRSTKGSPVLQIELSPGTVTTLALMKGPLLEALDAAFPGGKAVETGMTLRAAGDDMVLALEADANAVYAVKSAAPGPLLAMMETVAPAPAASLVDLDDELPISAPVPKTTTLLLDL